MTLASLLDLVAACFLVPLVIIDLRVRRLPDVLTLGGTTTLLAVLTVGALLGGDAAPLYRGLLGAVAMAGVLFVLHLASPSGMGFGDVKLGLLLGVLVGSRSVGLVVPALVVAGVAGTLVGVVLMVRHRRWHVTLPFGPCLVTGAFVALAVGKV